MVRQRVRVLALVEIFGLGHHAARARPAFVRLVTELGEEARGLARSLMQHVRLVHLSADDPAQALVASQTEDVSDMVCSHQAINSSRQKPESALSTIFTSGQRWRSCATMRRTSSSEPFARILIGRPEPRAQQLVAGEYVLRQIAVAVVVAVEEALRLMAIQRDVGRIQIEHDLVGRRTVRFATEIHQQPVDGFSRVADLVIPLTAAHQLQPVQSALAGQRLLQLVLAAEHSQQRIVAQLLMIVQVFIAQRQPVDALREHLHQLVPDQQRPPSIMEAGRQTLYQLDPLVESVEWSIAAGADSSGCTLSNIFEIVIVVLIQATQRYRLLRT
jgi:hypothetical protein